MGVSDIVREGTEKAAQATGDYQSVVQAIAQSIQKDALAAYGDFDPAEQSPEEVKEYIDLIKIGDWVDERIKNSRLPSSAPLDVLQNSNNSNAFYQESAYECPSDTWRGMLDFMATMAMKGDVYDELEKLGWNEQTGFSYEAR